MLMAPLASSGHVRHWLTTGTVLVPYTGPAGSDDEMRCAARDLTLVPPPAGVALGGPAPLGRTWRYEYAGANVFHESSTFYHLLEVIDSWVATELVLAEPATLRARLWASGTSDWWLNGASLARLDSPRYMYPTSQTVALPLRAGVNRICVRLQGLGVRDTRTLIGLELLDPPAGVGVCLPGEPVAVARLLTAAAWLDGVCAEAGAALTAPQVAPEPARVTAAGTEFTFWPAGQTRCPLSTRPVQVVVAVELPHARLERTFELPINRPPPRAAVSDAAANRLARLEYAAADPGAGDYGTLGLLARRHLGKSAAQDAAVLDHALTFVAARNDCADFTLAMLLRLVRLGLATPAETERIRACALAFRYWVDESGNDAMCYWSENHSLLFHGCQLLAGQLWRDGLFAASGRTGVKQMEVALGRIRPWLDKVEALGFHEFLSSTYMPITIAALLNLVDCAEDAAVARRARGLVDRILTDLARQAFAGVTVGPQGRVYRGVLTPAVSGTQALLSWATPAALVAESAWLAFPGTSPGYQPPAGLETLMRKPCCTRYRQNEVEIHLEKTAAWLLTSLALPAPWADGLRPGNAGYQQHLWQATLATDCHVFVTHPGASFDLSMARPGYWYGNGTLPRTVQTPGGLAQIFRIADDHPMPFTHAHWPAYAFDRQERRGAWMIGQRGDGLVGLWCSAPLTAHDEMLTGCELRAAGRRSAWLCRCAASSPAGGFDAFAAACVALAPAFDAAALVLRTADGAEVTWLD